MSPGARQLEQVGQPFDNTIPGSSKRVIYQGLSELGYPIWTPANARYSLITGRHEVWVKDTATAEKVRTIHSTVMRPPFYASRFLHFRQNFQFSEVVALINRAMSHATISGTPIPLEELRQALGVYFLSTLETYRQEISALGLVAFFNRSYLQLAKELQPQGAPTIDLAQPHRLVIPSLELIPKYNPRLAP